MTAETITPKAFDAYVFIESIRVVDRHRKDLGDLQSLMDSIEDIGLLHPPVITGDNRLVAGQRRIEACRRLGWDNVPVRIAQNLDEAARLLRAERDENTERKDMLLSEKASLGEALYAIESEEGRRRMASGGRAAAPGRPAEREGAGATPFEPGAEENKSRYVVAGALDMSPRSYTDLRYVHRIANGLHGDDGPAPDEDVQAFAQSCLAEMDRTGNVKPHADKVRAKVRARKEAQEAKAAALSQPEPIRPTEHEGDELDPSWIPYVRDNSPRAVQQRRKLIAFHADRGLSSRQIAETLGMNDDGVRKIAKKHEIAIPADAVMARTRRIDSNRVVRETVNTLEGAAMSAQLVKPDELDRSELTAWTESLTASIRTLNRLVKQLKELAS